MGKVVTREWRKAKVLNWNLHLCQLLEMIQVFDSISWVRCASGNVLKGKSSLPDTMGSCKKNGLFTIRLTVRGGRVVVDMKVDKVADEVEDMLANKEVDNVVDIVGYMEVKKVDDEVAAIVVDMEIDKMADKMVDKVADIVDMEG